MARKSINFLRLKRLRYVRAGPLPGHKKNGFSSRAMLGRYCNGAPQKSPNWGTEFGAENSADCGRLGRPPDDESPRILIRQALGRMQYIERMIEELDKETGAFRHRVLFKSHLKRLETRRKARAQSEPDNEHDGSKTVPEKICETAENVRNGHFR